MNKQTCISNGRDVLPMKLVKQLSNECCCCCGWVSSCKTVLIGWAFALNELKKESPIDPVKTSIQHMLKHLRTIYMLDMHMWIKHNYVYLWSSTSKSC